MKNNENIVPNVSERGNAVVITLILLLVVGAGAVFYVSQNEDMKNSILASSPAEEVASSEEAGSEESGEPNPVLAKVDGYEIKRQDVLVMMNSVPPQLRQMPPEQLFAAVLDQMINNHVIDKKAKKSGLEKDKDVVEQLEKVKEQIVRSKFLENAIADNLDEERIQAEYDQYVEAYKPVDEVRAAHILVKEEKVAKDIIKKLNKGETFADLAKENSLDGTGQNGGDLGFFAKAEVVPEFAEAAFSLEPGKYTKKPVKSSFGYHVIRVDEKRERAADSFDQMKPLIEQNLRRVVLEEVLADWMSGVEVERFDINGNPVAQAEAEPAAGDDEASEGETEAVAAEEEKSE